MAQKLHLIKGMKKENIIKMCILFILTSSLMLTTSGCFAVIDVIDPHEVVYTSHYPAHVQLYRVGYYPDYRWVPYSTYRHYYRVQRHHRPRVRYNHRVRTRQHHKPRLRNRTTVRRYNRRGKLRKRTVRRRYR